MACLYWATYRWKALREHFLLEMCQFAYLNCPSYGHPCLVPTCHWSTSSLCHSLVSQSLSTYQPIQNLFQCPHRTLTDITLHQWVTMKLKCFSWALSPIPTGPCPATGILLLNNILILLVFFFSSNTWCFRHETIGKTPIALDLNLCKCFL